MPDPKSLEERIDALEARVAYQDDTIETLNKTIAEQWSVIDRLKRELGHIEERLEDAVSALPAVERRPPHY